MPMPSAYRYADRAFRAFLDDVKDRTGLATDHMAYTAVDGVLRTFRRRLTPAQGIAFANVLPATLRAIFVFDWDVTAPPAPFAARANLAKEVQALRRHHNFAPDDAIDAVAWALRRTIDARDLDRVLATLPEGARDFWQVDETRIG